MASSGGGGGGRRRGRRRPRCSRQPRRAGRGWRGGASAAVEVVRWAHHAPRVPWSGRPVRDGSTWVSGSLTGARPNAQRVGGDVVGDDTAAMTWAHRDGGRRQLVTGESWKLWNGRMVLWSCMSAVLSTVTRQDKDKYTNTVL